MMNSGKERTQLVNREDQMRHKKTIMLDPDANGMIERFNESIDNIQDRFRLYNHLIDQLMNEEAEDLLRFQIVYLMSALDFYMHELYCYGLMKVFNNQNKKSYRYREYKVPLKVVEYALFDGENIKRHLKELFVSQNSTYTFMHPNRIKEMLNTISYRYVFDDVEKQMRSNAVIKHNEQLEGVLEEIYQRRNLISHQTDIVHGSENKNKINRDEVIRYSHVIKTMVEEIHQVISKY